MIKKKKALSPVIATVLLIAIVVVIGLIIFLWFRGLSEETITKFGKRNIKLVCNDVQFDADYSATKILTISNTGNVPIYSMKMKISMPGGHVTKDFEEDSELADLLWPKTGLGQGGVFTADMGSLLDDTTEITLIPVLVGKTSKGSERKHTCEERHGRRLLI